MTVSTTLPAGASDQEFIDTEARLRAQLVAAGVPAGHISVETVALADGSYTMTATDNGGNFG